MKKKRMIGRFLPRLAAAFLSVLLTACSAAPDTAQEAAKSLHCTVQQIYVRKSRAIKNLRDQLGGNK